MTDKKFTTRYNYKSLKGVENKEESKTFQECKEDCDINIMYRKYLSKGFTPPNIAQLEQRYADISNARTFEESLNIQEDVKLLFDGLPSKIREGCEYDVDTFIELITTTFDNKELKQFQNEVLDTLGMTDRKEVIQDMQKAIEENIVALPDEIPISEEK